MAATTSPDNIAYPTSSDSVILETVFATMASSIQTALTNNKTANDQKYSSSAASAAARDALITTPVQGSRVFRSDLGYEECYYAAYNSSTNPGGADTAGWYQMSLDPKWMEQAYPGGTQNGGGGNNPGYVINGNMVTLSGVVMKTTGTWAAGQTLYTLQAAARPAKNAYFVAAGSGTSAATLSVDAAGAVVVKGVLAGAPTWLSLDGWTFRL